MAPSLRVLHLDDDPIQLIGVEHALAKAGIDYAGSADEAGFFSRLAERMPDAVILDLEMNGRNNAGLSVMEEARKRGYDGPVIILSSVMDAEVIRQCVVAGVSDLVTKSLEDVELAFRVSMAVRNFETIRALRAQSNLRTGGHTIREVMHRLPRILGSGVRALLVRGESGTGKELVAEGLRSLLPAGVPFVTVNCGAIAESVLESELFGYEKGAFTGAAGAKKGLFAAAHGGWIFLDEVARLSASAQGALLRALESGEIRPVGSNAPVKVDVKVLAATNEDLERMAAHGRFRSDAIQRLRGYEINLPPLRERPEELGEILDALLVRLNERRPVGAASPFRLAPALKQLFREFDWREGNVREMWQVLQAATVEAVDGLITVSSLPASFCARLAKAAPFAEPAASGFPPSTRGAEGCVRLAPLSLPCRYLELEDELFLAALGQVLAQSGQEEPSGEASLARALGLSRASLAVRLERVALDQRLPDSVRNLFQGIVSEGG